MGGGIRTGAAPPPPPPPPPPLAVGGWVAATAAARWALDGETEKEAEARNLLRSRASSTCIFTEWERGGWVVELEVV